MPLCSPVHICGCLLLLCSALPINSTPYGPHTSPAALTSREQIRRATMGAHSRKGHKVRHQAVNKNSSNNNRKNNNNNNNNMEGVSLSLPTLSPPPPCLAKLHAQQLDVVEEGCTDVAAFALQQEQHANLIAHGVPQRVAELLLTSSSAFHASHTLVEPNKCGVKDEQGQQKHLQSEVLYMQIAAAGALRNLVVNSIEDAVVDVLAAASFSVYSSQQQQPVMMTFGDGLVALLMTVWGVLQQMCDDVPPTPQTTSSREGNSGTGAEEDGNDNTNDNDVSRSMDEMPLVPAAHALEEILQLVAVCVEGNEHIAENFSAPPVLNFLLTMLQATTCVVWDALRHPELFVSPITTATTTFIAGGVDGRDVIWLRHYERRKAELLGTVSVGASEVLHVLSDENVALATFLRSPDATAPHQVFLTGVLDAAEIMKWLREVPSSAVKPNFVVEDGRLLEVGRQNLLYQLCEVSLHVQGTLVNCEPNTANITRVLPLVVTTLNAHPPHTEWCHTVPLLLQHCPLTEELRTLLISRALHRLRCAQAAVNVLHTIVDAVCSLNDVSVDDETAFQRNPQANLLYESNAMFVVGKLMRDALLLSTRSDGGEGGAFDDQWGQSDVVVQQALRSAAGTSGTGGLITKLQLLVLSNEVGVWSLANTLLLMVPWSGLGDAPSSIWRAIIQSLSTRSRHLANDAAAVETVGGQAAMVSSSSPVATHLVWLQLESLMQMLWTLQRKQTAASGEPLQVTNVLSACVSDVDILTRLAWEPRATPLLRQACVSAVCGICTSLRSAEATGVAARFGLGVLQMGESLQAASAALEGSCGSCSPPPAAQNERRRWLLRFTASDAHWCVRCEAANHVMDLFLDETYDEAVYIPLHVHAALRSFLQSFQMYMKRRQQLIRDTQRSYRVALPEIDDVVHWCEVADNLAAFLEYKQQHIGHQRLTA